MSQTITEAYWSVPDPGFPPKQSNDLIRHGQQDALFQLAVVKGRRVARLRARFAGQAVTRVALSANLKDFDCQVPGCTVETLAKGYFKEPDPVARRVKQDHLRGTVVVVNSNDVGYDNTAPSYAEFFRSTEDTLFAAWDWDNHHWLNLSTFLAAHSDLYAPAHHEHLYLLTRYNATTLGPVYCAIGQWSRQYLTDRWPQMVRAERSNEPLGKHIAYPTFTYRQRVLTTVAHHYPTVGLSGPTYHGRTPEERLVEWSSHKAHWIVPVLNDPSLRIWDALVTGGIPIVPESLRLLPPVRDIGRGHVEFYGPEDIAAPQAVVARANALFDRGGVARMTERHQWALQHHHSDARIRQILAGVADAYGLTSFA